MKCETTIFLVPPDHFSQEMKETFCCTLQNLCALPKTTLQHLCILLSNFHNENIPILLIGILTFANKSRLPLLLCQCITVCQWNYFTTLIPYFTAYKFCNVNIKGATSLAIEACFQKPGGHNRVFVYMVAAPLNISGELKTSGTKNGLKNGKKYRTCTNLKKAPSLMGEAEFNLNRHRPKNTHKGILGLFLDPKFLSSVTLLE